MTLTDGGVRYEMEESVSFYISPIHRNASAYTISRGGGTDAHSSVVALHLRTGKLGEARHFVGEVLKRGTIGNW